MKKHYIAQEKFPYKIHDHIILLGNYFFNLYLVNGQTSSALFEVGISGIVDSVISQLKSIGVKPDYLIPSHPHSDHITGLPGLVEAFPEAEIIVASGAKKFLEHPKAGSLLLKEDQFMSEGLKKFDIVPGRPSLLNIPDLADAGLVKQEECIDLGGVSLELLKVDGHSPGNLMGRVSPGNVVLCSDSLGFHFPGREFLPLFFTGADSYLSTLERIQSFNPTMICPAHQGPLTGDDAAKGIQLSIDTTRQLIESIKQSVKSDEILASEIFQQSYKDEFLLYTERNIQNCSALLVKRAREAACINPAFSWTFR